MSTNVHSKLNFSDKRCTSRQAFSSFCRGYRKNVLPARSARDHNQHCHDIAEKTTDICRKTATTFLILLVIKLSASPENSIVGMEGGRPAASGIPPDFRLHQSGRKKRSVS